MKRALAGILLLVSGALVLYLPSRRYVERRFMADTGSCRVELNSVRLAGAPERWDTGSVILFHGLAANKGIMDYWARSLAELGLTVYVPDLPGHGRTPGPFTPDQAEACALSLVRGMMARGLVLPSRTILAGHSMGGAIALRIAPKLRPAGVIAISPAPMAVAHGTNPEALLYRNPPLLGRNTLILTGTLEPAWLSANAADLLASVKDDTIQYRQVPWNSHVSVLFSRAVAREEQTWAARVFNIPPVKHLPWRSNLLGGLLGFFGIVALAGPFLKELTGGKVAKNLKNASESVPTPSWLRFSAQFLIAAIASLLLLRTMIPLRFIHLFEGDYLASFFLVTGFIVILLNLRIAQKQIRCTREAALGSILGGILLTLLVSGWFQLSMTGTWLTAARWVRLPVFFLGAFPFLYAMEAVLGPVQRVVDWRRLGFGLLIAVIVWSMMFLGVHSLHTGEILPSLLAPYFATFFLIGGAGIQLVRNQTGSAGAAALFGAILLSGFCLVLFPVS